MLAAVTHALIIGGGIAGTATAMALHKAGMDVTVFEAYPEGGDDAGAFLTVGANGMLALEQLGAAEPVKAAGFPLTTIELTDGNGKPLGTMPLGGPPSTTPGHHHLRRAELYRVLQAETERRGITVLHGKRLTSARVDDDLVHASFADGSTATGHLLIGADGLHSRVRELIDPTAHPPTYAGQRVFYGYTTEAEPPANEATFHMINGKQAAFGYTLSPAGETWWFARVPAPELARSELAGTAPGTWRERLVEELRRDDTPAADIVRATGEELLADNIKHLPDAGAWYRGPMLIVGDAAHAASPAAGQGASMALEDAVMLAKSLRDLPDRDAAFAAYEQLRRNRVDRVITGGARQTHAKKLNVVRRTIRNFRARRQYAKATSGPRDWLYDYPLDWDIPVTRQLATRTAQAQLTGQ